MMNNLGPICLSQHLGTTSFIGMSNPIQVLCFHGNKNVVIALG